MMTESINFRNRIASLVVGSLFLVSSCAEEPAEPELPGADRDKYVGSWLCKEFVNGNQVAAFTINIQKVGDNDSLRVYNFGNAGANDYAIWLVSGNSITIPSQSVATIAFNGTGFYDGGDLDLTYNSDGEAIDALCTSN
ncbi:MAG: hypothetical protein ACO3O0_04765 [Bacteroidia bacterium]|jgi:hypothetical protein